RGGARPRARARSPRGPLRALRRGRSVPVAGGARLALVAAAAQHPAALAGEERLEVLARDVLELEPQLGRELAGVLEDVAELAGQRQPALVADLAAVVPDRLLGVLGDLARLAREPQRAVAEPRLARIASGSPRTALVLGELHARSVWTQRARGEGRVSKAGEKIDRRPCSGRPRSPAGPHASQPVTPRRRATRRDAPRARAGHLAARARPCRSPARERSASRQTTRSSAAADHGDRC